jgi:hypothetical protein
VAGHVDALAPAARKRLASLGVRIGRTAVFLPALRGRRSVGLRLLLAGLHARDDAEARARLATAFKALPTAMSAPRDVPAARLHAAGYLLLDGHAVRVDAAERLAAAAAALVKQGPFVPTAAMARDTGIPSAMLAPALTGLGFVTAKGVRAKGNGNGKSDVKTEPAFARPKRKARHRPRGRDKVRADSPFAALADLVRRS